jgi:hypothetical protein
VSGGRSYHVDGMGRGFTVNGIQVLSECLNESVLEMGLSDVASPVEFTLAIKRHWSQIENSRPPIIFDLAGCRAFWKSPAKPVKGPETSLAFEYEI